MSFKEKYTDIQNNITPDAEFLEQLAVKMERKKATGGANDDISLDITMIDDQKPLEVVVESRRASLWKLAVSAACLVCVLAVGIFAAVKLRGISSVESGSNDPTSSDNISDESSDNSFDDSSSSTSDTSGSSENEKIEAAIHKSHTDGRGRPNFGDENSGRMYVDFEGSKAYIPNLDCNYVYRHPFAYDLLNDSFVFAYFSGNPNSISFLSTTDKGKSWQSSELNVENVDNVDNYHWYLAFQNAEKFFLTLKSDDDDGCIIYTTEDTGKTWTQAGSISGSDVTGIQKVTAAGDFYWIAGRKKLYPVILKTDDGVNWREVQISIDTKKYVGGFCRNVKFYDDVGLAEVVGETADGKTEAMWYSSEDHGETWSFYRAYP